MSLQGGVCPVTSEKNIINKTVRRGGGGGGGGVMVWAALLLWDLENLI